MSVSKTDGHGVVWKILSKTVRLPHTIGGVVRQQIIEPVARKVNGKVVPLTR